MSDSSTVIKLKLQRIDPSNDISISIPTLLYEKIKRHYEKDYSNFCNKLNARAIEMHKLITRAVATKNTKELMNLNIYETNSHIDYIIYIVFLSRKIITEQIFDDLTREIDYDDDQKDATPSSASTTTTSASSTTSASTTSSTPVTTTTTTTTPPTTSSSSSSSVVDAVVKKLVIVYGGKNDSKQMELKFSRYDQVFAMFSAIITSLLTESQSPQIDQLNNILTALDASKKTDSNVVRERRSDTFTKMVYERTTKLNSISKEDQIILWNDITKLISVMEYWMKEKGAFNEDQAYHNEKFTKRVISLFATLRVEFKKNYGSDGSYMMKRSLELMKKYVPKILEHYKGV
jgi:hypothetical protein